MRCTRYLSRSQMNVMGSQSQVLADTLPSDEPATLQLVVPCLSCHKIMGCWDVWDNGRSACWLGHPAASALSSLGKSLWLESGKLASRNAANPPSQILSKWSPQHHHRWHSALGTCCYSEGHRAVPWRPPSTHFSGS